MNISTTRDDQRAKLVAEADRDRLVARAVDDLAALIEHATVPVTGYQPIWDSIAHRLHREASTARECAAHALDRLVDLDAAQQAYDRWVPRR
jgi:hypothetical protein